MRISLTIIEGILISFLAGLVGAGGGFLVHFGNILSKRIYNTQLRKGFGWVTLTMGCIILF